MDFYRSSLQVSASYLFYASCRPTDFSFIICQNSYNMQLFCPKALDCSYRSGSALSHTWQSKPKLHASWEILHAICAFMHRYNALDNIQPKARMGKTIFPIFRFLLISVETAPNMFQIFFWNLFPLIINADPHLFLMPFQCNTDIPANLCML